MGIAVSSAIVQNTITSLTQVVNSTVSNSLQGVATSCSAQNILNLRIGSYASMVTSNGTTTYSQCIPVPVVSQGLTVDQFGQNTCSISATDITTVTQNISNNISNDINNWLSANAASNEGFLGIGISIANSQNINQVDLSNMIANAVTSNLSQTCSAILTASNDAQIQLCGNYPNGIKINQSVIQTNLTTCIINNIVSNVANNSVLNNIVTKAAAQASATNSGVSSLFSWLKWVLIAIVIGVVLIVIGVILYFIFGSKSTPPVNPLDEKKKEAMSLEHEITEKKLIGENKASNLTDKNVGEGETCTELLKELKTCISENGITGIGNCTKLHAKVGACMRNKETFENAEAGSPQTSTSNFKNLARIGQNIMGGL